MACSNDCHDCAVWSALQHQPLQEGRHPRCPFSPVTSRFAVARGQALYHQGDRMRGGFSITSGMMALERVDQNGALIILRILQPGAFFPCSNLMDDAPYETSARALTDVSGCFVPVARLSLALQDNPAMAMALLRLSAAEIRDNEDTIFRLYSTDLPDRVLAALMTLADEMGAREANGDVTVTLPISWRDMAAMVGTGPEVISRLLRRLSDAGRLSFHGRKVTLHPTPRSGAGIVHRRQADMEGRALSRS